MHNHRLFWVCFSLLMIIIFSATLSALPRVKSITNISFGDYQASDGKDTIQGAQLAIGLTVYFSEQWAYFMKISDGSAKGEHENPDGSTTILKSSKTDLSGGLQLSYYMETDPELTPYVGVGVTLESYNFDFDYMESEIGKSSGLGYGPLVMLGVKVDLAKHFLIIPSYQFDQIYIKSENGNQRTIVSSGFSLALVIRF